MDHPLYTVLMSQVGRIPLLIVYVAGLVLAVTRGGGERWSLFAAVGFGLMTLAWGLSFAQQYLMFSMRAEGNAIDMARTLMPLISAAIVAQLAGLVLVVVALFTGRRRPAIA